MGSCACLTRSVHNLWIGEGSITDTQTHRYTYTQIRIPNASVLVLGQMGRDLFVVRAPGVLTAPKVTGGQHRMGSACASQGGLCLCDGLIWSNSCVCMCVYVCGVCGVWCVCVCVCVCVPLLMNAAGGG